MDIIPEAIEDAKRNAKKWDLTIPITEAGTAEEIIPRWYKGRLPSGCIDS